MSCAACLENVLIKLQLSKVHDYKNLSFFYHTQCWLKVGSDVFVAYDTPDPTGGFVLPLLAGTWPLSPPGYLLPFSVVGAPSPIGAWPGREARHKQDRECHGVKKICLLCILRREGPL